MKCVIIGKRLAEEYSDAISILKEKCKNKPKPKDYIIDKDLNTPQNKQVVLPISSQKAAKLNRSSNEMQIQQPTQGQQK